MPRPDGKIRLTVNEAVTNRVLAHIGGWIDPPTDPRQWQAGSSIGYERDEKTRYYKITKSVRDATEVIIWVLPIAVGPMAEDRPARQIEAPDGLA